MELNQLPSKILNSKKLIAIYCNKRATDKFLVGQILNRTNDCLLLSLISPNFDEDGICLCSKGFVFRIEQDSQYLLKIKKPPFMVPQHLGGDPWDDFWIYAEEHKYVTQIKNFSGKRVLFGVPIEHSTNTVTIRRVTANGAWGNTRKINREKIALLVCNSETEAQRQLALQKRGLLDA